MAAHALARDDAVAAHLVLGHGRDGDDRCAAVGGGDVGHAHAHLAVGYEIVAEQHEERLVAHGLGAAEHGMAQALGVILVGEGHGQR